MYEGSRLAMRLSAVSGIAAAVLVFIGVASVNPQQGVSDEAMVSWWADSGNRGAFIFSMYTLLIASPLLVLHFHGLKERLRSRGADGWADLVGAFGTVAAVGLGICAVTRGVVAGSVRFSDEPVPGVDTLRFATDLAYAFWDLPLLFAALTIGVAAAVSLAAGGLPRWLGWLGVGIAVASLALVVGRIAAFALPLVNIWLVASGVVVLLSEWRSRSDAPVERTAVQRASGL